MPTLTCLSTSVSLALFPR